jgi:hypothetical protein
MEAAKYGVNGYISRRRRYIAAKQIARPLVGGHPKANQEHT